MLTLDGAVGPFGWIMCSVLAVKQEFLNVDQTQLAFITVDILKMLAYYAQVSFNSCSITLMSNIKCLLLISRFIMCNWQCSSHWRTGTNRGNCANVCGRKMEGTLLLILGVSRGLCCVPTTGTTCHW